jgi:hypothetical protein
MSIPLFTRFQVKERQACCYRVLWELSSIAQAVPCAFPSGAAKFDEGVFFVVRESDGQCVHGAILQLECLYSYTGFQ